MRRLWAVEFRCDGEWRFYNAYTTIREARAIREALGKADSAVEATRLQRFDRAPRRA